jgi:D-glycero-D-manno-heptose 1,7-bisphosphate phosphatase
MGIDIRTRAVFLDRDGVINRAIVRDGKPFPPASLDDLEILPGVPQALTRLHDAGFRLIVVTNQPDVAKGTRTRRVVDDIHAHMAATLPLDDIRVCFHEDKDGCACRKPKAGMLLDAARDAGVSLTGSFMVGDRWRDIDAGRIAGCRTIFIDYGYDERLSHQPDATVGSLAEAADWILDQGRASSAPTRGV